MSGIGICHVCPEPRPLTNVEFCAMCGHYFCEECKSLRNFKNVWTRGIEAVKEVVGGKRSGCCVLLRAS